MFIKNYENLYTVTEYGAVFTAGAGNSNFSRSIKQLKPFKVGKDRKYLKVRLYKDGVGKDYFVHRLVAEAFLPNPNGLPHVHHKDEDTFHNSLENLEWVTAQYNKEFSSSVHLTLISPSGEATPIFNITKFCRENNLSNGCIYHLISGKYKQHKGWSLP